MSPESPPHDAEAISTEQIPSVEVLLTDVVARLALAAHVYLGIGEGNPPDIASAGLAIDVAAAAFEHVKERLRPEERLAITQLLTETRMAFVKKRGI